VGDADKGGRTEKHKGALLPLCSPLTPRGLAWDRIGTSTVSGQLLAA
jgi:hypothetical protein